LDSAELLDEIGDHDFKYWGLIQVDEESGTIFFKNKSKFSVADSGALRQFDGKFSHVLAECSTEACRDSQT
jgi:hypothetical protein